VYLKAELKYITVRTREREFLIEESLTSLEEEFSDRFVRIHRNALVARPSIAGFERVMPQGEADGGDPYWQVVLRDVNERLPVSRGQWSTVKNLVSWGGDRGPHHARGARAARDRFAPEPACDVAGRARAGSPARTVSGLRGRDPRHDDRRRPRARPRAQRDRRQGALRQGARGRAARAARGPGGALAQGRADGGRGAVRAGRGHGTRGPARRIRLGRLRVARSDAGGRARGHVEPAPSGADPAAVPVARSAAAARQRQHAPGAARRRPLRRDRAGSGRAQAPGPRGADPLDRAAVAVPARRRAGRAGDRDAGRPR